MPAKTNSQNPDRVIRQTEKIAAEIEPILLDYALKLKEYSQSDMTDLKPLPLIEEVAASLATYVIDYRERDWYEGWKAGFQAAKEGKSLKDEEARLQIPDGHTAK